jgi:hypothetical protein
MHLCISPSHRSPRSSTRRSRRPGSRAGSRWPGRPGRAARRRAAGSRSTSRGSLHDHPSFCMPGPPGGDRIGGREPGPGLDRLVAGAAAVLPGPGGAGAGHCLFPAAAVPALGEHQPDLVPGGPGRAARALPAVPLPGSSRDVPRLAMAAGPFLVGQLRPEPAGTAPAATGAVPLAPAGRGEAGRAACTLPSYAFPAAVPLAPAGRGKAGLAACALPGPEVPAHGAASTTTQALRSHPPYSQE